MKNAIFFRACVSAVVLFGALVTSATTQASRTAATPACSMSDVSVVVSWHKVGVGLPGGGGLEGSIGFAKKGAGTCSLSGWPRTRLYDAQLRTLPVDQRRLPALSGDMRAVLLTNTAAVRQRATAAVSWANWCKETISRPISIGIRLLPGPTFYRFPVTLGAGLTPSCVNPTASSLIDIHPFAAARAQGSRRAAGTCRNIQLLIRAQSSNGAAGTIGIIYRIHNMWNRSCVLAGYPGVQLLDRKFQSIPTRVHRGGGFAGPVPVRTTPIGGFGNAYFALFYSDVPAVNERPCATAGYVMIFAPNNFLPVVTYAFTKGGSITECTGNVYVSPVTAQPRY